MTTIYRDDLGWLERRLQQALGQWEAAREARAGTVRVHARRMARIAAGAVGEPARVLVATWVATALAYALGRVAGAISSTSSRR